MLKNSKFTFSPFYLLFTFLGGLLLIFIIAPIVSMALNTKGIELLNSAKDKTIRDSIVLTLTASAGATLIFAFFSIPLAYVISKKEFPFKSVVKAIIDIPVVIPHSAAGIAILGLVSKNSAVGKAGKSVGIEFIGTKWGIMLAMGFVSVPYLLNAAIIGFSQVPEKLEKAALNLGASPLRVFFTISLPLASRAIISGFVMMFARGMSEFGAVIFIAYHPMVTPIMIWERFGAFGLKYARPVALLFVLICLFVFVIMRFISKGSNVKTR
jgi:molybdate/tungstate transport system permease protein